MQKVTSNLCGNKSLWHYKLYSYIKGSLSDNDIVKLIDDKNNSFAKASHNSSALGEKDKHTLKLSYLITALRESILWEFKADERLNILIIDDRLYEVEVDNESKEKIESDTLDLLSLCKELSIDVYGLIKNNGTNFEKACNDLVKGEAINSLIKNIRISSNNKLIFHHINEREKKDFPVFDFFLVDLWYKDTESIRGLGLISELHHKLIEKARKNPLSFKDKNASKEKLPEILAYSISDDSETIQMAHRMGAAGYVVKTIPESFVLAMVRAGAPLKLHDATRVDFLSSNNFPIIQRVPRQIVKNLFNSEISHPNIKGQITRDSDLDWLRKIPKSDLHVHFGTAIPLKWCYILSLISLIHWSDYWKKTGKLEECESRIKAIEEDLSKVIGECLKKEPEKDFRRKFLSEFSREFGTSEVLSLKDVISYLVQLSSELLTDKQVACLINVMLGRIIFTKDEWKDLYFEAITIIDCLKKEVELGEKTCIHNLRFFRDCRYIIENIQLSYELEDESIPIKNLEKIDDKTYQFDPLSEMLSTSMFPAKHPYGLERYLAALDLVGSSILQFSDTLLLASMSIPVWAAAKKQNNGEVDLNDKDNVIHLELRTTPQGLLKPYGFEIQDSTIAGKLICVGLEFGIKKLLKNSVSVSANLLLSIKRDRKRESIGHLIRIAVDMRDEYKKYLKRNKGDISEVEGFMIPHVAGLDVAGIERGNLPKEIEPYYREAFERCLLSTIHAGETESARSVRDAVFMLGASRIGHGLSITKDAELQDMIGERSICIELCPKSNQFTNGFTVSSKSGYPKDGTTEKEYVYNRFRGKLLLTVNTDNPTVSHRTSNHLTFAYPLSEEFIWLSGMINTNEQIPLSRLEVLHLVYNGFLSMFSPDQAKKYIIEMADDELLSLLAEEYLDIDMGA